MKRAMILGTVFSLVSLVALSADAQPSRNDVGLGVSIGAAWPQGHTNDIEVDDWDGSFNWGFYVNIPLIYTFHITPSAELYRFNQENATDIALAFKFIIPVWAIDLYVGFVPGLTSVGKETLAHVGGLAGAAFNLFSNLDLFVQLKYKILFDDEQNMRVLHANAGILYHF